jgi:LmbE family N-acetylglucosaminyl deacetylase/ActR/RegA family two-component response regulator
MSESTSDGRKEVLVIEDSVDQATLIMRLLEDTGTYRVTMVQDGVHGSALAQERRWDLIVTDLNLPGTDGVEMIRSSKAMHPETPILAITAYRDQSYAARAISEGADGFLPKPFDRAQLLEKAEQLVRSGGTAHATHGPTVLAIGAHPDDVEHGCGGALLRHLDLGNRVVILVLSQGDHGSDGPLRAGEAELAARLMGARLVLADLPRNRIDEKGETVEVIQRVIEAFEPDVVYTHSPHDTESDHTHTFHATMGAAGDVSTIYAYQATSSTVEFRPETFVEITEYLPRKQELLSLFQTPEQSRPYLRPGFVEAAASYWGRFAGFGRVEPLEVVRARTADATPRTGADGAPGTQQESPVDRDADAYSSTVNVTASR